MKFVFLVPMLLATACNSESSGDEGGVRGNPPTDPYNDPGGGSTSYPYAGDDAAFVTVTATLDGEPANCSPVIYDLDTYEPTQRCGEMIAMAPNSTLMVTVGDPDDPCESCYATNQYGGGWDGIPLQVLTDGGKAIGVPQIITTPKAGETLDVIIELNQYAEGGWSCEDQESGVIHDEPALFSGVNSLIMPAMGELTLSGRGASYDDGTIVKSGTFTDSFTFTASSTGGMAGEFQTNCWAD